MKQQLEQATALQIGTLIREKQIKPMEALEYTISQIEEKEGSLHSYITMDIEGARMQAKQLEEKIVAGLPINSPLAGVPVAIKDNICTKDMKTTCASRILEHYIPNYDATAVLKLKEAGAIILGKTNMDEFAMGSTTETSAYGITRNPWNPSHVPGGSSGGSCCAVGANEAYFALGSDTGGSIRQPSGYCGVVGMKPTYGTVSRFGLIAYGSSLDQIGTIAKDVKDCQAILSAIAGKDPKDSTSVESFDKTFGGELHGEVKGVKIGIPYEYLEGELQEEVKTAFLNTAKQLENAGAIIEFFHLKHVKYAIPAYYILACAEASSNLERFDGVKYGYRTKQYEDLHEMYKKTRSEGFGIEVKKRIMLGSFVLSSGYYDAYYLKALKTKTLIKEAFDEAFRIYDLILSPIAPTTAPKVGTSLEDSMKMYLSDIYTVSVNLAGLPAMSIPCGVDQQGLPIGIQFIGDRFSEAKILNTAYGYEKIRGDWTKECVKNEKTI